MNEIFLDIGLIIIIASIFGYVARLLKQPLIPAYILAGIALMPIVGMITGKEVIFSKDIILTLSEIGIAFLLFTVGLELNLKKLRDIGSVATYGSLVQFGFLFCLGFLTATFMGYMTLEAVYIGLIMVFSSTMLVIKLLADKKELDSLHGRIIIGVLLMQDILAIFAISILSTVDNFSVFMLLKSLLSGFLLFVFAFISSKYLFPKLFKFAAKNQELLFILSVSVAFSFSMIFQYFEFSIAIGAFVAGVSLANLPYNLEIVSRMKPLKDFFSTIFFVSLGLQVVFDDLSKVFVPIMVLLFFIIVIKSIFNFVLVAMFGYEKRTSFLTALSLSQVSEFGIIIIGLGVTSFNHLSDEFTSLIVILAAITLTISSYFIKFSTGIYNRTKNFLNIFNFLITEKHTLHNFSKDKKYDVLLIGYDRIGYAIFDALQKISKNILVVDFNPDIVKKLMRKKVSCMYGDIGDMEILNRIDFKNLKMVVSTIPEIRENDMLIDKVKVINKKTPVFVTSLQIDEALDLYDHGADYVILPHFLGGEHVSLMLEDISKDITSLFDTKIRHIKELNIRKMHGHHHH